MMNTWRKQQGLAAILAISLMLSPTIPVLAATSTKPVKTVSMVAKTEQKIDLLLGKARVIRLTQPASRVSISNPNVAGVVLISPTEIQLVGKNPGSANLLLWGENSGSNYTAIDIGVHQDVTVLTQKLRELVPGVSVVPSSVEQAVILSGIVDSSEQAQLAYDLTKAFLATPGGQDGGPPASDPNSSGNKTSSFSQGSSSFSATNTRIINLLRVKGQPSTKAELVQQRLKEIDSRIVMNVVPGNQGQEKIILTGRVKTASMASKAISLASAFYGTPGLKIVTGPGGNKINEQTSQVANQGASYQAASNGMGFAGNTQNNVLQGTLVSDASDTIISMLEIDERPQIRCVVKILEVTKGSEIGLDAATKIRADGVRFGSVTRNYGGTTANNLGNIANVVAGGTNGEIGLVVGNSFATVLSGLIRDNRAKILAEPTITVTSGEPANFLAGGEIPVVISTINGQTILWKQFGVMLNILPTVTERGTIHMQITPEVSSLGPTVSTQNLPTILTRRSQSVLEMKNGDNFVLSGLYNDQASDDIRKTPLLGQLPVLGSFFRSKAYSRNQTELVIVVHPEIKSEMNLSNLEAEAAKKAQAPEPSPLKAVAPVAALPTDADTQPNLPEIPKASVDRVAPPASLTGEDRLKSDLPQPLPTEPKAEPALDGLIKSSRIEVEEDLSEPVALPLPLPERISLKP